MKNIKTLALALVAVVGMAAYSAALLGPINTPRDQMGEAANPLYGGFQHKRQSAADELIVCSGRCLLAGLILNTGPATTKVSVRNSSVANGAGALVFVHRFAVSNTEPGNNPVRLPILLDKGITVTLNAASTEEEVTVLYQDLD